MATTETRWRQGETGGRTDRPEIRADLIPIPDRVESSPTPADGNRIAEKISPRIQTDLEAVMKFQDAMHGKRRNAEVDGAVIAWALASIGRIADEVDRLVEATGATVAAVSARSDRIDRVQAQNRIAIDALRGDARR